MQSSQRPPSWFSPDNPNWDEAAKFAAISSAAVLGFIAGDIPGAYMGVQFTRAAFMARNRSVGSSIQPPAYMLRSRNGWLQRKMQRRRLARNRRAVARIRRLFNCR